MKSEFSLVDFERYFLLNINLSIFPLIIAPIILLVKYFQKVTSRSRFIETNEPGEKDKYISYQRSFGWAYNHLIFPLVMMFNMAIFFQNIATLTSKSIEDQSNESKMIEKLSFAPQIIMNFGTLFIYLKELFSSEENYRHYKMSR